MLKVWHDVVEDGLGRGPLVVDQAVRGVEISRLPPEDIGLLTQPVEPERWFEFIADRYRFLDDLDADEERLVHCSPGDSYFVNQLVRALAH